VLRLRQQADAAGIDGMTVCLRGRRHEQSSLGHEARCKRARMAAAGWPLVMTNRLTDQFKGLVETDGSEPRRRRRAEDRLDRQAKPEQSCIAADRTIE